MDIPEDKIPDLLKQVGIAEAWCKNNNMSQSDFFIREDACYCRHCYAPMMRVPLIFIEYVYCLGCQGTISKVQIEERTSLDKQTWDGESA